jgi:HD-like signal output (HDOD) protein
MRTASPAAALHAPPLSPAPPLGFDTELAFFAWLLNGRADEDAAYGRPERQAVMRLDALMADTAMHKRLLPRAPSVLPQLLARLRDPATTLPALVEQISRDVTLVAEVVRMANGALYRRREAVVELSHAIRLLGVEGLRVAIARAVLQPLIDVRDSAFMAECARRLWSHADKKAQLCATLAAAHGLEPFDSYLLGLAHDAAWSAVLRSLDDAPGAAHWAIGTEFVAALALRRDRLFGLIVAQWKLSADSVAAATTIAQHGLSQANTAQATLLTDSDALASLLCLGADSPAHGNATAQRLLDHGGPAVKAVYAALRDLGETASAQALH